MDDNNELVNYNNDRGTREDRNDTTINASRLLVKKPNNRVKPKFFKLLGQVMNLHVENVLNFLETNDLAKMRSVNKLFLAVVHDYYPKRLRYEVDRIKAFQEANYETFLNFMKIIDSQIPISHKNWLEFDLNLVIAKLRLLDKNTITNLKAFKNLGKLTEAVFAPFCIILGYNKTSYSLIKSEGWKKVALKILVDPDFTRKLQNLDLDNLNETDMLDAFVYLNLPELEHENMKKISPALERLVLWCQGVVSYHVLIHPFTYRNDKSQMLQGSEMYNFVTIMNKMLDRFYKFKRFLINLNIMTIPLAEYVFNLQHNREKPIEPENFGKKLDEQAIGKILSYVPIQSSHRAIGVNKTFKEGFKISNNIVLDEILKEIFFLKIQAAEKDLNRRIPIFFEKNIFSNYFLMLDDILNGECLFMSKEQINDIKNIKIENEVIKMTAKIACLILNETPQRRTNKSGEIEILYMDRIKMLAINGQLNKQMKNINKLDINNNKLAMMNEELVNYLSLEKLEEVKKINRGIHQLLIWELLIYELNKTFNPFDFINPEFIVNRFEKEEIEIIKYYSEIMNYLKFNLKVKFKFCKGFEFRKLFDSMKYELVQQNVNVDTIFENSPEYAKINNVYFDNKDLIPLGAKPAFFERIYLEILKIFINQLKQDTESEIVSEMGSGIIRDDNSIRNQENDRNRGKNAKDLNKLHLYSNITRGKKRTPVTFNDVPQDIIIKHMLFFLDINSLPKFSLASKKTNESVKTHIFIRLHFLNKEKKIIEQENSHILQSMENKRSQFFEEYEIDPPTKEHAIQLMQSIRARDVTEIKQCFKKPNKNYEEIISPVIILLGEKPKTLFNSEGIRTFSYFSPAQKLLNNELLKKLMNFELETIPQNRFTNVEKLIESPTFKFERIKQLSPCLHNLLMWVMGVVEFHRVIRKYSLSSYDYDILSEDEITFAQEMDSVMVLYYKLLRYANTHCKNFERQAYQIMGQMNINLASK